MRAMLLVACLAAAVAGEQGTRFHLTDSGASLVEQRLASAAPTGAEASTFQEVSIPGVKPRPGQAAATEAPWVDSNGWRYLRGLTKAKYAKLPAGTAPLAAAEVFAYGVEAILEPDPTDIEDLGQMLRFLASQEQPRLPVMANVAVVDDRSPAMGELLNMLTRRNLLYRVASAPDPALTSIQLGTQDFPKESALNPSEFAARVRAKIGDDNRLVRIYGTSTAIAHLTGDRARARLVLVAYGTTRRRAARNQQNVRIRMVGSYQPSAFAGFGAAADAQLSDIQHLGNVTEFSLPPFSTVAVVDLKSVK